MKAPKRTNIFSGYNTHSICLHTMEPEHRMKLLKREEHVEKKPKRSSQTLVPLKSTSNSGMRIIFGIHILVFASNLSIYLFSCFSHAKSANLPLNFIYLSYTYGWLPKSLHSHLRLFLAGSTKRSCDLS